MKKTLFIVREKTFRVYLNIFLNYTFDEMNGFLKKKGMNKLEEKNKVSLGVAFDVADKSGLCYFCIWIRQFEWTLYHQGIFAHELIHAVAAALKDRGVLTTDDNTESFAYLYEYLFYNSLRVIGKRFGWKEKTKRRKPR